MKVSECCKVKMVSHSITKIRLCSKRGYAAREVEKIKEKSKPKTKKHGNTSGNKAR